MANQLALPESKEFPHKPTYDALYMLYGVLTGLLDFEIDLHFRGGLTVDQSVLINDSLTVIEDTILGSSGADTLTVQASSTFVNDVVIQGDLDVQGVFTMAGDLTVPGNLQVNGNTVLGNAIGDTTLIAGPATLNSSINVKGNTTLGDAIGDTVSISGPATLDSSISVKGNTTLGDAAGDTVVTTGPVTVGTTLLVTTDLTVNGDANVKGSSALGDNIADTTHITGPATLDATLNVKGATQLGDAEADTVTIVDWVLKVTSNDLLFTDDGGGTVVKICDQSSTYQLDVAIGDFHVADDAVIDGDITTTGNFLTSGNMTGTAGTFDWLNSGNSRLKINSTGVGFFGSTPIAKPTVVGSRGGNAALNSLCSELANLGLIINLTS